MAYYRKCPICGAALDPGEICDCQDKEIAQKAQHKKEAVPVLQHQDGPKVENGLPTNISTSMITE